MNVFGIEILTPWEFTQELNEARDAVRRLAAENYHLHRALDQTGAQLGATQEQLRNTERFLAVLQGEQIRHQDEPLN